MLAGAIAWSKMLDERRSPVVKFIRLSSVETWQGEVTRREAQCAKYLLSSPAKSFEPLIGLLLGESCLHFHLHRIAHVNLEEEEEQNLINRKQEHGRL